MNSLAFCLATRYALSDLQMSPQGLYLRQVLKTNAQQLETSMFSLVA